uniref:DNA helicase MCM8 n=1 Tax=Esox lucius TaxID=8010 RepID=A0A6Q2WQ01_ESOLU
MSREASGRGSWRGRGWRGGGGWRGRPWRGNSRNPSTSKPGVSATTLDRLCPYKGWTLYFTEGFVESSLYVEKIKVFEQYFTSQIHLYDKDEIERQGSVLVDYKALTENTEVCMALPDLANQLREQPEISLNCLGLAIHQVLTLDLERHVTVLQGEGLPGGATPLINIPHISARLYNYEPLTALRMLRASVFGRLVCVRGTVVRVSNIRPLCTRLAFTCSGCSHTQSLTLTHGKFTMPTKCMQPECRSRSFVPNRSSPLTLTVDWQTIKVQELIGGEQREAGRIPRTVECHLTSDLCDSAVPGDTVTITGIVRVSQEDGSKGKKDKCMFLLYIEANSVSNSKGSCKRSSGIEFSLKELYAIQEIHSQPNLLKLIVHSLCPAIYGHLAVCNVAPRGIYVCGNTTSTSGLTVTLSREAGSGDYSLEAGALVLGDQGLCCIDEFDKLGQQQQALLEAMEQQTISLAKAGLVCSLPARTSVIAAANPVGGHYNRAKTVSENLKMGSALLSRFDVVFLLLDVPDESHDRKLSEHVMAVRSGKGGASSAMVTRDDIQSQHSLLEPVETPLSDRLQVCPGEYVDPIPPSLLRKYVGYARRYVHPSLSASAAQTLQEFYLSLRSHTHAADATPITTRQLESLIRLTELEKMGL